MSNSRCKTSLEGLSPSQGTVNHSFDAKKVGFRWAIAAVTCNKSRQMPFELASQENIPNRVADRRKETARDHIGVGKVSVIARVEGLPADVLVWSTLSFV